MSNLVRAVKAAAWLVALAWVQRTVAAALGLPRVPDLLKMDPASEPQGTPSITVIVPARNEAFAVEACLRSLLAQDSANCHIIAVNDRSSDETAAILDTLAAEQPAHILALHVPSLPSGWLGKTHAMAVAAQHAQVIYPAEWLLFTDADVLFHPSTIRLALASAVALGADHLVVPPSPILVGAGELALLGFFQVMGTWSVRLWRVADPRAKRDVLGIGAFGLVRTSAYRHIGGWSALRMAVLEDVSLARRIKAAGLQSRAAFGVGMVRLRWAEGALGLVNVLTKNLFALFGFHPTLLVVGCGGIALLTLAPLFGLCFAATRVPSAVAVACIAWMYSLLSRYSRLSIQSFWLYPAGAVLLIYSLLRSMVATLRQGGIWWRGTFYSLAELRRHSSLLG